MSLAFLNGHTRAGAVSADVVSTRLTQTDTIEAGALGVGAVTANTLTVNVSATLGGTVTFAGPLVMNDDATFNDPATFNDTVTVAAGSTVTVGSDTTFNADVVIGPGHTLTVDGATVSSTAGRFTVAGDSTFGGDLEASTISGNPSFTDGAAIPLGETLAMAGATLSGGPALSGGATVTSGQTLTFTGATLAGGGTGALTGVATINGLPYPPAAAGPVVDVAVGLVFPTMTIPAAGAGAYRVTNASLAGMANNAPDPGTELGGIGGAGIAFVTGFTGDIAGRTELLLFNASSHVLRFAAPIVSNNAGRGRLWFPGTRARATRATAVAATWVVEVDDLRFQSPVYDNSAAIAARVTVPGSTVLANGAIEYSVHAFSDAATDDLACVVTGRATLQVDRTAVPALDPIAVDMPLPVGWGASAAWSALPGFLPVCGTLDGVEFYAPAGFATPGSVTVGTGAVFEDETAWARADARAELLPTGFLRVRAGALGGVGNAVTIFAPFRIVFDRYTYLATF